MSDAILRTKAVVENVVEDYPEIPTAQRGPLKTAVGFAREIIAEKDGVKPESVRMREYRESHRKPALRSIGMELDATWLADVRKVQAFIDSAAQGLARAKTQLKLALADPEKVPGAYKNLLAEVEILHRRVALARPESLCPACKGIEQLTAKCAGCETLAWITKNQAADIPKDLWDEKEPKVISGGKRAAVSTFFRGAPEGPTIPAPEVEEGDELPTEDEEGRIWP